MYICIHICMYDEVCVHGCQFPPCESSVRACTGSATKNDAPYLGATRFSHAREVMFDCMSVRTLFVM